MERLEGFYGVMTVESVCSPWDAEVSRFGM